MLLEFIKNFLNLNISEWGFIFASESLLSHQASGFRPYRPHCGQMAHVRRSDLSVHLPILPSLLWSRPLWEQGLRWWGRPGAVCCQPPPLWLSHWCDPYSPGGSWEDLDSDRNCEKWTCNLHLNWLNFSHMERLSTWVTLAWHVIDLHL